MIKPIKTWRQELMSWVVIPTSLLLFVMFALVIPHRQEEPPPIAPTASAPTKPVVKAEGHRDNKDSLHAVKSTEIVSSPFDIDSDFCLYAIRFAKRFNLIEREARVYRMANAAGAHQKYYVCMVENSKAESIFVESNCVSQFEAGWNSKNWTKSCLYVGNVRPDINAKRIGFLAENASNHTPLVSLEDANVMAGDAMFCLGDNDVQVHMRVTKIGLDRGTLVDMVHAPGIGWAVVEITDPKTKCSPGAEVYTATVRESPSIQQITLQPGPAQSKDIWTTSVYSYTSKGGGPGGGRSDDELVVGGWGDSYYSLLQFDLRTMPPSAQVAKLELFCFKSRGTSTVGMLLDRVIEPWNWRTQGSGPDRERLWWADRPHAIQWQEAVLPPCNLGTWYAIDITSLYNAWQSGAYENYGLQLRPSNNDNRWNEFYSSRYSVDASLRPRLIVQR